MARTIFECRGGRVDEQSDERLRLGRAGAGVCSLLAEPYRRRM